MEVEIHALVGHDRRTGETVFVMPVMDGSSKVSIDINLRKYCKNLGEALLPFTGCSMQMKCRVRQSWDNFDDLRIECEAYDVPSIGALTICHVVKKIEWERE